MFKGELRKKGQGSTLDIFVFELLYFLNASFNLRTIGSGMA